MTVGQRGFTLIETCVAMTIGAALLAVVVGLFGALLRVEQSARAFTRQSNVINCLADRFRRDVHATPPAGVSKTVGGVSDGEAIAEGVSDGEAIAEGVSDGEAIAEDVSDGEAVVGGVSDGDTWQFSLAADHTVTYRVGPGEVTRVERLARAVHRQQAFPLPRGATASIEVLRDISPAIVRLAIAADEEVAPQRAALGASVQIDAVLGTDRRFNTTIGSSGEGTDE